MPGTQRTRSSTPRTRRYQNFYTLRGPQNNMILKDYSLDRILDLAVQLANKSRGVTFSIE
jgi:hypothetical protein